MELTTATKPTAMAMAMVMVMVMAERNVHSLMNQEILTSPCFAPECEDEESEACQEFVMEYCEENPDEGGCEMFEFVPVMEFFETLEMDVSGGVWDNESDGYIYERIWVNAYR